MNNKRYPVPGVFYLFAIMVLQPGTDIMGMPKIIAFVFQALQNISSVHGKFF